MWRPGPAEPSYRLRGILGKGAEAIVYHAQRLRDGHEVALKCLQAPARTPSLAQERAWVQARRRLRREMSIARSVDHPNVVKVFEYQEDPEGARLALELVRGSRLRYFILDRPALIAGLFAQVCAGIGALHRAQVAHRDIKPGNVVVEDKAGVLRPVIVDFGLATTPGEGPWEAAGTIEYVSPEVVAKGAACSWDDLVRSDLYAASVTLFEILTGDVPFCGAPADIQRQKTLRGEDLGRGVVRLGDPVGQVALRGISPDPADRFGTAAEMVEALAAAREQA